MTLALILFFCVAVPFAFTLGVGLAMALCAWVFQKLGVK